MIELPNLPVRDALGELHTALRDNGAAVLVAPPGAGKTTLVPLALLGEKWSKTGRIIVVEPRRVAARAAARRMTQLVGDNLGATVGYAMRMDNKSGPNTRILVVTEGVFTRMALDDPELAGISAVLFDEFHERSLDGDFGLALALDIAAALRPDLRLLAMSATLEASRVGSLMGDAPIIRSEGRSYPVDIRYQPRKPETRIEDAVATAVVSALAEGRGSCLAFLPGQREISRTAERLKDRIPALVDIVPLHGGLDGQAQDAAIRPAPDGRRKIVLATSIAETSITIDGVDTVIDSGLSRLPKFEPATGLTRLETVRVSRASAEQRAGRAGRTSPGLAIRLWHEGQTASLAEASVPEILEADLSRLLLDCAAFGVGDPADLRLLDSPPKAALSAARKQLLELGALDRSGSITATGKVLRDMPLPVRLSNMVIKAAQRGQALMAAEIALLLTERGLGGSDTDLDLRLSRFRRDNHQRAKHARSLAKRLAAKAAGNNDADQNTVSRCLLDACPDRVAKARGNAGHFVLANGRGAVLDETEPLAREQFIIVADLQGEAQNARITAAASLLPDEIEACLPDRIERKRTTVFDRQARSVRQRELVKLGAVTLREHNLSPPAGDEANQAIIAAVREHGLEILPWTAETTNLLGRLSWLNRTLGGGWPDMAETELLSRLEEWLLPFLTGDSNLARLAASTLKHALLSIVPFDLAANMDKFAPSRFEVPTGSRIGISYADDAPTISVRVQELFGLDSHPSIAGGSVPLKLELLSPANRPIQTTIDLPGFWRGSWTDVRKDMKSRYPKHVWPENPLMAKPTTRAKPRAK